VSQQVSGRKGPSTPLNGRLRVTPRACPAVDVVDVVKDDGENSNTSPLSRIPLSQRDIAGGN